MRGSLSDQPQHVSVDELLSHASWVRGLAYSLVRDDSKADDLVQETWVAALRSPPADKRNLRGWLRTVVTNRWRQDHRSDSAREDREVESARDEVQSSPDLLQRAEAQREVVGLVTELDEPYRAM